MGIYRTVFLQFYFSYTKLWKTSNGKREPESLLLLVHGLDTRIKSTITRNVAHYYCSTFDIIIIIMIRITHFNRELNGITQYWFFLNRVYELMLRK